MQVRVYMRVAEGARGPKVAASTSVNYKPLTGGAGWNEISLATAAFALDLDIPDEVFQHAEQVLASIDIPADRTQVAVEVGEVA